MKICIFAEGSYPYSLGGVSSWLQLMIKSCPEFEFIIYVIGAEKSKKGKYKYDIPENVVEIREVFLDEMKVKNGVRGKNYKLKEKHRIALQGLLNGDNIMWEDIFEFFKEKNFDNVSEFFMSRNFYNLVMETYKNKYPFTPFTEFLWCIRSMYITLFYLLMQDIPKADVYHTLSAGYAGILGSYAKYIHNSPYIVSEHGIYTREREEEIIKSEWIKGYHKDIWIEFFISLSKCAYDFSDKVTSLFDVNKELQVGLGCEKEKIEIIPNGVDVSSYENLEGKDNDDYINIGTIARVVPIKDIKTMLLAFDTVRRKIENVRLYIMGPTDEDVEYYNECKDLVKALDIKDVIFTGTIKVLDYIGKMDILLLTSLSEGQPLAIMEGMAAKKPHVATNVGDCKGLLNSNKDNYGQSGFIETVMNYKSIADSIIKLCENKELRENMGRNGYNKIKNMYTKDELIKRYKEIYLEYGGGIKWLE